MNQDRGSGPANTAVTAPPTVLVAIDFSDDSRAAMRWAGRYAALAQGRLVVLHVVHDPADQPGYYRENHGSHLQPMQAVAETMLDEFVDGLMAEAGTLE